MGDVSAMPTEDEFNRLIVSGGNDCQMVLSLQGRILHLSAPGARLIEATHPERLLQADWTALWDLPERAAAQAAIEGARQGRTERFSTFGYTLKRTPKWWDTVVLPIPDEQGQPRLLLAVSRDITELHRREQQIRELNAQLEQRVEQRSQDLARTNYLLNNALMESQDLYDNAPCGYHSLNAMGVFVAINNTALSWLGRQREEVVGLLNFRSLLRGDEPERFDASLSWLLSGRAANDEPYEIFRPDGSSFHALLQARAVLDFEGRFVSCRASMIDITARRQAEMAMRSLNAELAVANADLEGFSYTVSHDLRAPLRHVKDYVGMLREHLGERTDDVVEGYLDRVNGSVRHMSELIEGLLAFARLGRTELMLMDVDVGMVLDEVRSALPLDLSGREVQWVLASSFPVVRGDPLLLRQAWSNLVSNALKYSRTRAVARIEIGCELQGRFWQFTVRDNGVGFNPAFKDKLFGVFQRLHNASEFEGTGIGLALTRRIIERHGGSIRADAIVDEGCTMQFTLPASQVVKSGESTGGEK